MCRAYDGASPYVRLCYRKGARRGEHVPLPPGMVFAGCYPTSAGARRERLTFRLPTPANREDVADMLRYAHCRVADRDGDRLTMVGVRDASHVIARAATFGWRVASRGRDGDGR